MKNPLALLAGILLFPALMFSQETLKLGINAGATYSSIRGNAVADRSEGAVNFLIGTSLEYPLTEKLSVLANLNFERKSFTNTIYFETLGNFDPVVDPAFMTGSFKARGTLNYITLPVNLKYYLGAKKAFYINGGPYAGFFISETTKVDGNKVTDDSDTFKTIDFGVNLGIGTRIAINEKSDLNIELRDCLGLTNISKVPVIDNGTVKTNSLALVVGWQFGL